MFKEIPKNILERMHYLESLDARDRIDGTPRMERLRQIPPETGRFLAFMASMVPDGHLIEVGTSAGYSTLWLSLAARRSNRKIITFEYLEEKAEMARETFGRTETEEIITLIEDDALNHQDKFKNAAFCFLDAEKEVYRSCYDMMIPNLVSGGLLIADNVISHKDELQSLVDHSEADERVDAVVVAIGKGLLVCRKI